MKRRDFLRLSGLAAGAATMMSWEGLAAWAGEVDAFVRGPAVEDHPLRQLSPHVWAIIAPDGFPTPENRGMMCNLVFVDTSEGLLVIDTGASVQIGEMAIRQLQRQFAKPVIAAFNTHYHGDHFLGNAAFAAAFPGMPIYAHPQTVQAIAGVQGDLWRRLMEQWTNQASLGTEVVVPTASVAHGDEFRYGNLLVRIHHYGTAHTPADICIEVVNDAVVCVGDVAMDRRIANMDDGSYLGTLNAYRQLERNARAKIWVPGHGQPGGGVLDWNRELFEGIYQSCERAVAEDLPLAEAKTRVLSDPRVASKASETKGFESNIGKYVSLAYLEAEAAAF
ncbi:MBL fold metallo-hydrolase [Dechloromonas sp. ZY10]|uniref:MBL fold metallo-hydrolase n=1 Tax=Dechloromonas aquae TaxID=2664436 RepID=UPI00352720F5